MTKSKPRIRESYEMTAHERACCECLGSACPPGLHDPEYAPVVRCFLREYHRNHPPVAPDPAEMVDGYLADQIYPASELEHRQTEALARRRKVVDDMLEWAGYSPTQAELEDERKRCKRIREWWNSNAARA